MLAFFGSERKSVKEGKSPGKTHHTCRFYQRSFIYSRERFGILRRAAKPSLMAMKSSFRDVTGREETGGGEVHNCQDGCPKTIEITSVIKKCFPAIMAALQVVLRELTLRRIFLKGITGKLQQIPLQEFCKSNIFLKKGTTSPKSAFPSLAPFSPQAKNN